MNEILPNVQQICNVSSFPSPFCSLNWLAKLMRVAGAGGTVCILLLALPQSQDQGLGGAKNKIVNHNPHHLSSPDS